VPHLCKLYPGICLTTEGKHGKTSVRVAGKKQNIQNRAYITIIHKHDNKNIYLTEGNKSIQNIQTTIKKKEPKDHHYTATLHCTSPHFTQLHFTTLIDTSLPHIHTSLPSHLS